MNDGKKPITLSSKDSKSKNENNFKQTSSPDYQFKFHLIGDFGVGKSSLLLRYTDDTFTDNDSNTIDFDYKVKTLQVNGKAVRTQVWYSVGYGRSQRVESNFYQGAHAVIVAFDLTDYVSFNNVERWLDAHIANAVGATIILVGTKSEAKATRVVERNEVDEFISNSKHNIEAYIETSAKTGENVQLAFETATKLVLRRIELSTPNVSLPDDIRKQRNLLIACLDKYIKRIESHKNPKEANQPDFAYGFWHHRNSRAANREANYYLAKDLLKKLQQSNDSIELIFDNIDGQRGEIIRAFSMEERPSYKNRSINSDELTKIIHYAKMVANQEKISFLKKVGL